MEKEAEVVVAALVVGVVPEEGPVAGSVKVEVLVVVKELEEVPVAALEKEEAVALVGVDGMTTEALVLVLVKVVAEEVASVGEAPKEALAVGLAKAVVLEATLAVVKELEVLAVVKESEEAVA